MLKLLVFLTVVSYVMGQGLEPGPQPGEGELHPEKKQTRRNLGFPFVPIYIPYQQIVEVHHVVMLQQPDCVPSTRPGVQPPNTVTQSPGLMNRLGGEGDTKDDLKKPSRCVWAIVACCSPDSTEIRYSCFELLGCPGVFWGVNPCEPKVVESAANTALNYYKKGGEQPSPDSNIF